MAALDFPPSPAVGTKYPDPPQAGVTVYVWDGEKWTSDTGTGSGTGGPALEVTFAPSGNLSSTNVQTALVELDTEKVAKSGDTMLGPLVLVADPTVPLQAATKQYVDSSVGGSAGAAGITFTPAGNIAATNVQAAIVELDTEKVAKAGDTMTGALVLSGPPTVDLHAATKKYVDDKPSGGSTASAIAFTPAGNIAAVDVQAAIVELDTEKVAKAGDTMTGPLILSANPTANLGAATKQYVDGLIGGGGGTASDIGFVVGGNISSSNVQDAILELDTEKVAKAGDTMTGHLTLPTGPAAANAVRKDYVDAADTTLTTAVGNKVAKAGDTMTGFLTLHADPDANLKAATKQYVDNKFAAVPAAVAPATVAPLMDGTAAVGTTTKYAREDHIHPTDTSRAAASAIPVAATAAEYRANSQPTKMVTSGTAWSAAASVGMTDAATITPDFALGFDFTVTLGAAGRTMANPVNVKPGQKGFFAISPGAAGTITTWGTAYKFPGGTKPTLTANGVNLVSYWALDATNILCTSASDFK